MLDLATKKRERIIDLLILLAVSWFSLIITSIYVFKTGNIIQYDNMSFNFAFQIYNKLLSLGVLLYILHKQRRNIKEIGLSFRLKDILHSILIITLVFITQLLVRIILNPFLGYIDSTPNNIEFIKTQISFWYILFIFINPWFEELIIRGYLMTEIKLFSKNIYLAVFVSVIIQSIAHLYQGYISVIFLTIMFLIFSIYFAKTKRIFPVILAHLFFDILAMIIHAV
mgnify:CR=1 FL=1